MPPENYLKTLFGVCTPKLLYVEHHYPTKSDDDNEKERHKHKINTGSRRKSAFGVIELKKVRFYCDVCIGLIHTLLQYLTHETRDKNIHDQILYKIT